MITALPSGWRRVAALWWTELRKLRLAPAYALAVLAIAIWLRTADAVTRSEVLFWSSTNVHNLSHNHWWVLVTSCFVSDTPRASLFLVQLAVIGLAEILWGRMRAAGVFLLGNVLASLIVYVVLRIALVVGLVPLRIQFADDVGSSYGMAALLGGLAAYVPGRQRPLLLGGLVAIAFTLAVLGPTFTDLGHLTALVLGMLAGGLLRHPLMQRPHSRGWRVLGLPHPVEGDDH
jgi:hypothetical protein